MAKAKQFYVRSQADIASFFGVSVDTVKAWSRAGMPRAGASGYNLGRVAKWLRADGPWRARSSKIDDPLLIGADSPALERYRLARAEQAEWDLREKKRIVISRDTVHGALSRFASIVRRMGDRLAKRFGPDAAQIVNDTLEDCQRVVDDEFGGNGHFTK